MYRAWIDKGQNMDRQMIELGQIMDTAWIDKGQNMDG